MKEKLFESDLEEKVLSALKNIISGSEWDGKIYLVGGAVRDIIMCNIVTGKQIGRAHV